MFDQIISSVSSLIESTDAATESVVDVVETATGNDWLPTAGIIVGAAAAVGAIGYGTYRLFSKSEKVVAKKPFDLDAELAAVTDDPALIMLAAKVLAEGKSDLVKARRAKASAEKDFGTSNKCLGILNIIERYEYDDGLG